MADITNHVASSVRAPMERVMNQTVAWMANLNLNLPADMFNPLVCPARTSTRYQLLSGLPLTSLGMLRTGTHLAPQRRLPQTLQQTCVDAKMPYRVHPPRIAKMARELTMKSHSTRMHIPRLHQPAPRRSGSAHRALGTSGSTLK